MSDEHSIPADSGLRKDFSEIVFRHNLSWLMYARDALILNGPDFAEIVFGLREPLGSWLVDASGADIHELAQIAASLTTIRLPMGLAGERLLAGCANGGDGAFAARLHALAYMAADGHADTTL